MGKILKRDTNGVKGLLDTGEFGYDNYPAGGDAGRVYIGTGTENLGLAKKTEVDAKLDATANAVTATRLKTARTINGVAFDGSANITVEDATKVAKTSDTGSAKLPVGTTAQRDAVPVEGMIRYNSTVGSPEVYRAGVWGTLLTDAGEYALTAYVDSTADTLVDYVRSVNKKRRNYLINGNFQFWDYATSQTTAGYGSDNRWSNNNVGSTKTHSRMSSGDTERALFESPYYSRTVVSSVAGVGSYVTKNQAIEDLTKLAGKQVTLSFWAKADSSKNIVVNLQQGFGTGGSPSSTIANASVNLISLTTSWKKYSVAINLPSIVGKVLGTDGVHTSYTHIVFWFDAGSNFNSITNNLGQQSGTFDIAEVKLEDGSVATDGWAPYDGEFGSEAIVRQRYYQMHILQGVGHGILYERLFSILPVTLRLSPSASLKNLSGIAGYISADTASAAATINASAESVMITVSNTTTAANVYLTGIVTLSAEL